MIRKILLMCVFSLCTNAWAYIPSTEFILGRMAQKGGRGSYKIVQELLFQTDNQSSIIKETWSIKDSHTYFLEVRGKSLSKFYAYKNGQRFSLDSSKQVRTSRLGPEFFEYLFLARDTAGIKTDLIAKQILPAKVTRTPPKFRSLKDVRYPIENFVHLTRNRGVVDYTFSETEDLGAGSTAPALWVEQDKFVIRKIRLNTSVDVAADDVADFSQGLSFPKSRRVSWGPNSVQMELLRADSVTFKDEVFKPEFLKNFADKQTDMDDSKIKPLVEEFYSRFR